MSDTNTHLHGAVAEITVMPRSGGEGSPRSGVLSEGRLRVLGQEEVRTWWSEMSAPVTELPKSWDGSGLFLDVPQETISWFPGEKWFKTKLCS